MRPFVPILALAALGLSSPAAADVTARYAGTGGKYAPTMSIAVDESGQVRAEAGPPNNARERVLLIRREGVDYLSASDAQGRFVARVDDLIAIADETIRATMPQSARDGMRMLADVRIEVVEGGMETLAGRQGRVYWIATIVPPMPRPAAQAGEDAQDDEDAQDEAMPPPPLEIVLSEDPALAPVGREMARLFEVSSRLLDAVMGTRPAAIGQIRDLLARGTLIRAGDQIRLRSVSTEEIADSAFALPGPVLTRAEVRARAPRPPARRSDAGQE